MRLIIAAAAVMAAVQMWAGTHSYVVDGSLDPPMSGAEVVLSSANSPMILHATSETDGGFRFRDVAPGAYTIWVSAPGQEEALQTVEIGSASATTDGRVPVKISLHPPSSDSVPARNPQVVSVRELSIPDAARKEYAEAVRLLGENDPEGATRRLKRAVSIAPGFWAAWDHLGVISYHAGRYSEAESFFRRAHAEEPEAFDPISNLGGVLLNLGRYQEALPFNTRAVRQRPGDVLANSQAGINYFLMNQFEKALGYLKEAKRLDPFHFTHPQRFLAEIYLHLSDRSAAAAELEDFVTRHPDAPEAALARRRLAQIR